MAVAFTAHIITNIFLDDEAVLHVLGINSYNDKPNRTNR